MDIVEELRRDRESGAKRLETEYKAGLMTLARRFCNDEGDAEELVNRTFAEVINGIDDYLEQSAFFAWMCQILVNLRKRDNKRKSNKTVVYPGVVPEMVDDDAQEAIYRNLDYSLLRDAIAEMPTEMRELLLLHYFMEIPIPKLAKILAVPAGTVKSRLHYARSVLAAKMGVAVKKPGGKAVLLALLLCGITALGAAVGLPVARLLPFLSVAVEQQADSSKDAGQATGTARQADACAATPSATSQQTEASNLSTFQPFNFSTDNPQGDTMNISKTSRTLAASAAFAAATAAIPAYADIYVAKTGSDANPGTLDAPKLTIQAGVDAVASGGTVYVAPGIYGAFTESAALGRACVVITNKAVTLRATGGRAETVILGRRQSGTDHGMGPDAVRCIVATNAENTIISGFTIRNGCTALGSSGDSDILHAGGGVYTSSGQNGAFYVVDCDIQSCSAEYGGGANGGRFIRCRFTGCIAAYAASAANNIRAFSTVFAGNRSSDLRSRFNIAGVLRRPYIVNCTMAFNEGTPINTIDADRAFNCIIVGHTAATDGTVAGRLVNCATDAANASSSCVQITSDDLFSPATGDWRLKTGSAAVGAGDASKVSKNMSSAYTGTDLLGNTRKTGDTVNCGAVEASATAVETGASFVSCAPQYGLMAVDGAVTASAVALPLRVESLPAEPTVSFLPVDGYDMVALASSAGSGDAHWPLMDETVPMRIAAASATAVTNTLLAGAVYHVAPSGDDVNGDGSAAAPYATFAKAMNLDNAPKLVLAHPGNYGHLVPSYYRGSNRVEIAKNNVRIKAVAGPEATVIPGASDPTGDSGLGTGAVRCVAFRENLAAVQGFTLRGGRTATGDGTSARGGGAQIEDGKGSILDCVIEDCIGAWGSAIASGTGGGHAVRCIVRNCSVPAGANANYALALNANLDTCLFYGNSFPSAATSSTVIGPNCNARFCTVAGTSAPFGAFSSRADAWNCIVAGTTGGGVDLPWNSNGAYDFTSGLFGTSTQDASNYTTAVQGKPRFSDASANDYRLQNNSAALTAGSLEFATDRNLVDVTGRKFDFAASASGSCIAGCYADTVSARNGMVVTFR